MSSRDWLDGLRAFAAEHRLRRPLASAGADPASWNAERSILGATLATRLAEVEAIRETRRRDSGVDGDPAVVVTTTAAGIVVLTDLLAPSSALAGIAAGRVLAVTELEYRLWCIGHPDEASRLHVNLWSWVKTRVPPQRWAEFSEFPLQGGESYWLHREGLAGAGELDRRACHLWKWNGRHAALLKAFIPERTVRGLGGRR